MGTWLTLGVVTLSAFSIAGNILLVLAYKAALSKAVLADEFERLLRTAEKKTGKLWRLNESNKKYIKKLEKKLVLSASPDDLADVLSELFHED